MSLRTLGYSLLLFLIAAMAFSMKARTQQSPDQPQKRPRWEYQVISLDAGRCSSDGSVQTLLNSLGRQSWELVSYAFTPPAFPKDAEGTLLIAPAATGSSRDVNPPTADSFRGSINLKMDQSSPGGCRVIVKREVLPEPQPK